MTPCERQEIEKRMQALDNHALHRLVAIEASDYRPEAVEIARTELKKRKLAAQTPEQYFSEHANERRGPDGFCEDCRKKTTNESPGSTFTLNFLFGTRLIGDAAPCPVCDSVIKTLWIQIIFPVIPLGKYRVIYLERDLFSGRYVGRKLRKGNSNTTMTNCQQSPPPLPSVRPLGGRRVDVGIAE